MANPVVLIAIAGLGSADIKDRLPFLPEMQKITQAGTLVSEVVGVLPSQNAPAMTSATTGVFPKTHGVVNQLLFTPDKLVPSPFAEYKTINAQTLFDLTAAAKMPTAAFGWPVGGGAPVTWQLDVNASEGFWGKQMSSTLRQSAPLFAMQMRRKFGVLNHRGQPSDEDDFLMAAAVDTLTQKRPQLMALQFIELAQTRHRYGVRSQMAFDALQRIDRRLGELRAAAPDANFVIIGDAYQRNVDKVLHLNKLFAENGWLKTGRNGQIGRNWRVVAQTAGNTAYIYLRDAGLVQEVRRTLKAVEAVKYIFEHDEIVNFGADTRAAFMIQAMPGYYFGNSATQPVVDHVSNEQVRQAVVGRYHAVSGQHPDEPDSATVLLAAGPNIAQLGPVTRDMGLVDLAPTVAALLGVFFVNDIAGRTANWLLRDMT
jgi:predicted AlkP superfamily pyrophosphatase or phosphodiesterase